LKDDTLDVHHALVERCKKGDQRAYKELYDLYSRAMFNLCFRFVGDKAEAEDVLQDAFINAFKSIQSFQGRSSFGSWLKRIVINMALSHLKKSKQKLLEHENVFESENTDIWTDEVDCELTIQSVRECIEKLPTGFRIVLTLYLLEGYDHGEISGILGISESTSKTQYSRAKARLRTLLGNQ
jgi:RNA polymerase sigma-70 factor (ECF subfamily)